MRTGFRPPLTPSSRRRSGRFEDRLSFFQVLLSVCLILGWSGRAGGLFLSGVVARHFLFERPSLVDFSLEAPRLPGTRLKR